MREPKYHIYLDDSEYHRIIESLMALAYIKERVEEQYIREL